MRAIRPVPLILVVALAALMAALTVFTANAQSNTPTEVHGNWALVPSGLGPGDSFRLLFITSGTRDGTSSSIGTYNTFVQNAAASGHTAIRGYSSGFRVVGSTAAVDARDNTSTTYTSSNKGVPIYWLGGNKLADNYQDFYDGSWDDEVNATNASGTSRPYGDSPSEDRPFTGSEHNGTEASNHALGDSNVRLGRPNNSGSNQGPLSSINSTDPKASSHPFYGLSEVFRLGDDVPDAPTGLTATANGSTQIDLDWSTPASDGGWAITGYRIEHTLDGGSNWSDLVADTDSTATEYSDTGLPAGATRYYRVSAINAAGASDASNVARASADLAEFEVPYDWGLIPSGLGPGDSFRLLFVSAGRRTASPDGIVFYNAFVQKAAASGHADIQEYSSGFRAVGSTEDDDARDNTATTYTAADKGIPIHWLGGSKVADDYEDFYDGDWDDEVNATNASGTSRPFNSSTQANRPFTGSNHNGTGNNGNELGESSVRVGRPNDSSSSRGPINGGSNTAGDLNRPFYGLSAVFRVDPTLRLTDVAVISNPAISDTYGLGETIEIAVTFNDEAVAAAGTDFVISVGGKRRAGLIRGSGTKTLVFGYTVQAGDSDDNGIWIGDQDRTLVGNRDGEPQNGAITSSATGDAAVLTHAALLTLSGHKVDGTQQAPQVTIAADQTAFTAELDAVTFTLTRTDSTAVMTVAVELTQDQEFLDSGDRTQSVMFESGEPTASLVLEPRVFVGHEVTEDGTLTATVRAGAGYVPGTEKAASTSILVISPAVTVRLEEASYTFDEDGASVFVLVATTASGVPSPNRFIAVSVSALKGTARAPDDYENLTDFPTFQPSDFAADGAVFTARLELTLMLVDDALDEEDETFSMALQLAPGTPPVVGLRQHDGTACVPAGLCSVTATITDNDDPPTLSVAPAQAKEGESLTFTVTLSAESGREVTVDWTTASEALLGDSATSGTDFTAGTGTLTFTPRTTGVDQVSGETAKTFTVATTDDTDVEDDETFTVTLSNPSNATISDATAKGTIENDDAAPLVSNIGQSTDTWDTSATFSQRFTTGSNESGYTLTGVDIVSGGTRGFGAKVCEVDSSGYPTSTCTDLTPSDTFAAGTLSFTAPEDATLMQDKTYAVVASPTGSLMDVGLTSEDGEDMGFVAPWSIANEFDYLTTGADATWQTDTSGGGRSMRIAIRGTAILPTLSIANATDTEGGNVTFTVTLSEEAAADVTATWTATIESGDTAVLADDLGTTTTGMVTVTAGQLTGTFPVATAPDTTAEEDETFTVTLSGVSSNAQLAVDPTAKGTIEDDDAVPSDDCSATATTTCEVDVGGSATGNISSRTDFDWFGVDLEAGTRYQIDLEGAPTSRGTLPDPDLRLFDGVDFQQDEDDGSGVGANARIIYTPTATGTYYAAAGEVDGETGTYRLSVIVLGANGNSEADTDFPATTATTGRVEVGASATGNLRNNSDVDWFRVDLEADKQYQFDQEGAPTGRGTLTDPRLALFSGSGISLALNDDISSTNLNSRIVRTATETGAHYLRATRSFGNTGTYTLSVHDITPPPSTDATLSIADAEGDEDAGVEFTATLTTAVSAKVTATWTASIESGDTASAADLAATKTGEVEFDADATEAKFTVPVNNDTTDEPDQTFTVTLSGVSTNAQLAADPTAEGTIDDDDDPPTLTVADVRHDEGDTFPSVIVSISEVSEKRVRFMLRQVDRTGDTASDADFEPLSSATHSINVGVTSVTRTTVVAVSNDTLDEDDETLTVEAYSLQNAEGSSSDREATITIVDDDPTPTVTVAPASATEGDKVEFVVTLSAVSGRDVEVGYATSVATGQTATSDTDFTAATGTLTILASDSTDTGTVEVQTAEDDASEGAETFTLTLSATKNVALGTPSTATGTINDETVTDDCLGDNTTTCEVDVGGSATGTLETEDDLDWFKVELEASTRYQIDMEGLPTSRGTMSDPNLVVRSAANAVLATDDDGGVGANSRVIYTPTAAGTHYLEARAVNDDTGTYTLSVIVLGANGASEADTDFPEEPPTSGRVEVGASVTGNVAGDSDQDQFVVDLVAGKKYQFDLEGAPTGRGTLEDPYLSISGVSSNFDLIADNDNINATNKNSQLVYTATETGTYYLGAGASDSTLTGTYTLSVREVTPPTLIIGTGSGAEGGDIGFAVVLSAAASANVTATCTVSFESGDTASAADFTTLTATATITAGRTSGLCLFTTVEDTIDEEDETFTVTLSNPSANAQLGMAHLLTSESTIRDDDDPPTVSVGDVSGTEGTVLTFTVALSDESGKTVTVDWAASAETGDTATPGTDFTAVAATTLTFDPGQEEKMISVQTTEDADDEEDETFTVTLSSSSNATISDATAKGTIENDDEAPLDVLVSNYPDGSGSDFNLSFEQSGNSQRHYIAQTFTAGAGFTLTAVDIPFRRVPDNSRVTVSLHALNGSKPGTYLAELDLSGALAVGDNTFAAPAGTALAAGSYFVRVRWRSGNTNNLLMTDGPDDETSAESGWSIEDRSQYSASGSSWSNWNQQFAMRVRGTIDGMPRVATGGVRIESDPDAHDSYGVGEEIEVAVGFTDDVTVDTTSGTPRVELTVGSNTRYADYSASDSSADELAFLYEVTADDQDQDGVSIDADALELNGGAIHKDGDTSTNAVLGHAALDADSDHRVNRDPFIVSDGVSVISDPQALADTYGLGEVIEIEVEFSAEVDAATGTDFVLSVSGPKRAPLLRGSGTKKLVFGYTVVASDDDDSGIWIGEQDRTLVGNREGYPQNGEITSAVTDRAADLDHDSPGVLSGHKVDGSRTTDNVAPSFTSDATIIVAENETAVGLVRATDRDADDSVTGYAITGGADQTFFSIGATSGVLTFDAAPDYEDAQDQGNNNTYVVDVTATSGADTRVMTATQTITVTVTDVDTEAPGKPGAPAVASASATSLSVNWSAPSNTGPAITDYDYRYRPTGSQGSWTEVTGTTITATTVTIGSLQENISYQVQVRAKNAEGTGSWSDSGSGTTDAAPDNCTGDTTTTCEVDVGGSATGNIGSDREQDWFKVELEAGKRYQFDVEGADTSRGNLADPYLWGGYDSTGSSVSGLRSNDGGVGKNGRDTYTPTAAGTYYIAVADATFVGRGTYTLSVIVLGANGNSEANTDCPATTATTCRVDVGASATGNIGSNDIDWFRVDLETGKKYQFDLEGADTGRGTLGDPNLSLFDGSGIYIGVDDNSGTGLNSQIVYTATETGAHYLRATRTLTGTGTYTLSVRDVTPPPDDCTDNTATTCEVDVGGSAMGNIDSETDVDWFRIDLVSDTRYQFDLEGDDTTRGNLGDPYLQLANSLGNVLGGTQNRDSGVGDNARVIWTPANIGNELVYLIVEGAANTTGSYTLSVIVLGANGASEADTDCSAATTTTCQVEVGASATGNIADSADTDWFRVDLEADRVYQIDMEGADTGRGTLPNPRLRLYDASGVNYVASDTEGGFVGNNARLTYAPDTSARYFISASRGSAGGTYTLSVREVETEEPPDDLPANTTTTGTVEVDGSAVRGDIYKPFFVQRTGDNDVDGWDFDTDWFAVDLEEGRTYRIDMKGAIYVAPGTLQDPELTLPLPQINAIYDSDGEFLVNTRSRDESSAHHLFRVTFHAHDDGAHYIAASGESFEKGGYKLRVIDITRDDDATPVAVTVEFGAASYTATEGGTAAAVTVNLSADPGRSVTIPVTAAGANGAGSGDYTLSETSVTIDSGETSATFIVTATDDSVDDDGESVDLSFGTLPDAVSRGAQATTTVSLVDNDSADTTAPTVDSATVSQDGTSIDIVFDEDLDATGSAPAAASFTVTVGTATGVSPASVAFHATEADTITLTMAATDTVAAGAAVTVAYDQPTSNALADAASNEVESFTGNNAIAALNRPAAPGKPQNVQLVFEETTSGYDAKLSWDAPDDLGGGTLQRYSWLLTKSTDGGTLVVSQTCFRWLY